ncbi:MAG: RNA polymerase sigma factor (sigma-70 family) [Planctomycetota bacterium]|jgi:RNA polymerase sigma factor (sigma-70 family)
MDSHLRISPGQGSFRVLNSRPCARSLRQTKTPVLRDLSTAFVRRLQDRDAAAWYELWEIFAPVLRAQLSRWGRGRIGPETVQDLSQETLAALSGAIDRHDPSRGARFSTWLLAIAKHTLGDEIDRRMALKRGSGVRPASLEGDMDGAAQILSPDDAYERNVFDAKVGAALRAVERDCGFAEFEIFRMRILQGNSGKDVAVALGTSEPTISRRLKKVREVLRTQLLEVFSRYSFTEDEWLELSRNGLDLSPNKSEDAAFDESVADIYHRLSRNASGTAEAATNSSGRS